MCIAGCYEIMIPCVSIELFLKIASVCIAPVSQMGIRSKEMDSPVVVEPLRIGSCFFLELAAEAADIRLVEKAFLDPVQKMVRLLHDVRIALGMSENRLVAAQLQFIDEPPGALRRARGQELNQDVVCTCKAVVSTAVRKIVHCISIEADFRAGMDTDGDARFVRFFLQLRCPFDNGSPGGHDATPMHVRRREHVGHAGSRCLPKHPERHVQ